MDSSHRFIKLARFDLRYDIEKKQQHQFAYIHLKYDGLYFTEYWVHNFEIRVGEHEDLEKND